METRFRAGHPAGYGAPLLQVLMTSGRQDPFPGYAPASVNDAAPRPNGQAEDAVARNEHERRTMRSHPNGKELPSDIGLRLIGLLLIALSAAVTYALFHLVHMQGHIIGLLDCVLALVAFVSASAGSVMLCLGAHMFDEVAVSSRWRTRR